MNKLDYYIDEFSNHLLIERGLSQNTVISYNKDIIQYADYLNQKLKIIEIKDVNRDHINEFLSHLYDLGLKPKSISRKISSIKVFHKFLFLNNYINENVSSLIIQPKLERTLPQVLSIKEVEKLLDSFSKEDIVEIRNKTMVELMYSTGLRVSELVNLNIEDVHLSMGFIKCVGKGSKERIVPIGERAIHLLEQYINIYRKHFNIHYDNQILFLNQMGTRISRQQFWKIIKEQSEKIALNRHVSPHKIRHSFATHMLENHADIRFIQELLGHSDISTTQIYTHINSQHLNEVITNFHPRVNRKGEQDEI